MKGNCKTAQNLTSQVYRSPEETWTLAGKLQGAIEAFLSEDKWLPFLVIKEGTSRGHRTR